MDVGEFGWKIIKVFSKVVAVIWLLIFFGRAVVALLPIFVIGGLILLVFDVFKKGNDDESHSN